MANPPRDFDIPEAVAAPKRRGSLSIVWLIPLVAVVIGGWLAYKAISDRGPTITITFKTAEGLEAGKTKIKYKEVDVGQVTQVALNKDRQGVVATAELVKGAKPYLVEDTRFWIVRPRVSGGVVSGLGTLFSGSYIGVDIGKSTKTRTEFTGLNVPPVVTGDTPGRQFVLHSETLGSLDIGSPVYFRRVPVGQVVGSELDKDGQGVTFKIFLNAPYDQYVNPNSRFWNASGIDVTLDSTGIKVDTQSLASILIGGIAFETLPGSSAESPAEANTMFALANSRAEAMKRPDAISVPAVLLFTDSLRGLAIGSPVEFRGINIGEVKSMDVEFDQARSEFRFPVGVAIYPQRLLALAPAGSQQIQMDEASRKARWNAMVEHGLRGQLRSGSLLTGQLYVSMDFFPNAPKAHVDWTRTPPVLPTVPGVMTEIQETLSHLARKLQNVPLDQIGSDARIALKTLNRTLESADTLVKRLDADVVPSARSTLDEVRRTLTTAERTLNADAPLQQDLRGALRELSRAAQAMRVLADYLERHPESLIQGKKGQKP